GEASAVELLDLAVEGAELAHPPDCGDPPVLAEHVRVLDHVDPAEGVAAKRRARTGRRRDLRETPDEEGAWRGGAGLGHASFTFAARREAVRATGTSSSRWRARRTRARRGGREGGCRRSRLRRRRSRPPARRRGRCCRGTDASESAARGCGGSASRERSPE